MENNAKIYAGNVYSLATQGSESAVMLFIKAFQANRALKIKLKGGPTNAYEVEFMDYFEKLSAQSDAYEYLVNSFTKTLLFVNKMCSEKILNIFIPSHKGVYNRKIADKLFRQFVVDIEKLLDCDFESLRAEIVID